MDDIDKLSIEHIKAGYRSASVQSHLIFYKWADDGIVEIVRILHRQMDIEILLHERVF
jgi:toxin ParE1/3/4